LDAAARTGAEAVHPGYGFLAENASFARAVLGAGLIWVGPTPDQIDLLGDKVAAKDAALAAGVPTAPVWTVPPAGLPEGVTFPALVKAAAGGGGRGMRVVESEADLAEAIASASREAESSFGDGTVFIEPFIERGRHIEVQVIGDKHGNVIHLGERDCSVQRRNQKVIEESPASALDPAVRDALLDGAVALARHVGYENAGTVEFMVGADGTVNFLEVNTRLQVEHPVTEAVTGLDLVELQLRCAEGTVLPLTQEQVSFQGHAIEARLVAEDPGAGWLPSVGELSEFRISEGVRVDSGVRQGSTVSADYDSLLAKVISHADTRAEAATLLAQALRGSVVAGVQTNVEAVAAILREPGFLDPPVFTSYLDDHREVLAAGSPAEDDLVRALCAAAIADEAMCHGAQQVWGFVRPGWRNLATQGQRRTWIGQGDLRWHTELICRDDGTHEVLVGEWPTPSEDEGSMPEDKRRRVVARDLTAGGFAGAPGSSPLAVEVDGLRTVHSISLLEDGSGHDLYVVGSPFGQTSWSIEPRFVDHDAAAVGAGPVSPLPGTVMSVSVAVGDSVSEGDTLMVVEAMKMEHQIRAASDAVVTEVRFAEGDKVDTGELLVALDTHVADTHSGEEA
jgi:propionyl-CoA carboxylase alpha chain